MTTQPTTNTTAPKGRPTLPRPRPRPNARRELQRRPAGELKCTVQLTPPDAEAVGAPDVPQEITIELRTFTLAERQLAKRALAKQESPDATEVVLVHAWVVWKRTHPGSKLQTWMDNLTYGEILDGMQFEPGHVEFDTTPEGFDPQA